jgi:hypothetical protein
VSRSVNRGEWRATFRVEAITLAEPEVDGWLAYDIVLRPLDRRGRVNGRTRNLSTLKVGGPPESMSLAGLVVGRKAEFAYWDGPAPTNRAVIRPA